ncbi:addiction module protein [Fulvivirga maritima]|uniref:addiction module protein n=1 Tax=Fulvivirga maritima TaxID=2904247 RepID=UPI001F3A21EA|nr:addiction module protein [Fulvivirga maritima]UII28054.1 addiction module protein [Fulvivirga maritima]
MKNLSRLEQVQHYLQHEADDRFINMVFGMIEAEQESQYELSPEHRDILDERLKMRRENPGQGKTWEEVKKSM